MKIALYGGSFDPVHQGHLEIIKSLFKVLSFDQVFVIPTNVSYYKENERMFSYTFRANLVKDFIHNDPYLKNQKCMVSMLEKDYDENSGFYETVLKFKEKYPKDNLSVVIGYDSYVKFKTWRNYKIILENATLVVVTRDREFEPILDLPCKVLKLNLDYNSTSIRKNILNELTSKS